MSSNSKLIQNMDWFSWLSRTNLDPSLIYQYGVLFARNELQNEDIGSFNHEFLISMGISIAKHRLEILKLARKESGGPPISLSKLISAISKTKNSIKRYVSKLVFHHEPAVKALPEPARCRDQWRGVLTRRHKSEKVFEMEKLPVIRTRRQAKSGPLDGKLPENLMLNHGRFKLSGPLDGRVPESLNLDNRNLKVSGPLDGKVNDRLVFSYKSPSLYSSSDVNQRLKASGGRSPRLRQPSDGNNQRKMNDDFDGKLLWAELFQDMKPT